MGADEGQSLSCAWQYALDGGLEAGTDEAGRGPLAGPVVAAAVILPLGYTHRLLRDSKKLSRGQLLEMREEVIGHALHWAEASVPPETIDRVNILRASLLAMRMALEELKISPELTLVDGNKPIPDWPNPQRTVVHGDSLYAAIAAASILAKTARDAYMENLHNDYPQYGWAQNKGYSTKAHREAIAKYGLTPHHRRSFCHGSLFEM